MLLVDIRSTNASAAEFILYRLKLYLAGRHRHHHKLLQFGRVLSRYLSNLEHRRKSFACIGSDTCIGIYHDSVLLTLSSSNTAGASSRF